MRIDVLSVSKSFGAKKVLERMTAHITGGSITALVGPSGVGKSTLLSIIGGSAKPDHGEVVVRHDGRDQRPAPALVAWVPQGSNALPHRSTRDNAALGALSRGCTWDEAYAAGVIALERVGLEDLADRDARQLSGGELQRLAFARALCAERPIILADEPTANLDSANTVILTRLLKRLSGTSTVVVATHDPLVAEAADAVIDLRELARRG